MNTKPILFGPDNKPIRRRNFDAAKMTRYTSDWIANSGPADQFIKQDVKTLRDRARDSERNDGYAEGILATLEANIVGQHGIKCKPLPRKADARYKGGVPNKIDTNAQEKIAQAWDDYSKVRKFDVTRKHSRAGFERLAIRSVVRDGGFLVRTVDAFPKNEFGFAVQGIETDALDPLKNDPVNRIHMGMQYDEWDEVIAYHLRKLDFKSQRYMSRETFEVKAENMIHLFLAHRINQSQGYSWLATALLRLRHLMKFEEAETIAARVSANKLGFFKRTGEQQYEGDEDSDGNIKAPSSPGEFETLPYGVEPHMIDPAHPNSNMPEFRKAILRGVSPGVHVNYNTWAQDLEGVSFSSIRQGVLAERDIYRMFHSWFIDEFETPLYERWLRMALTMGQIEGLDIRDYDRLKHAEFSGRTWAWVDPLKDIQASREEIALGLNSRQRIAREKGLDFDKLVTENEDDVAKLEAADLPSSTEKSVSPTKQNESDD